MNILLIFTEYYMQKNILPQEIGIQQYLKNNQKNKIDLKLIWLVFFWIDPQVDLDFWIDPWVDLDFGSIQLILDLSGFIKNTKLKTRATTGLGIKIDYLYKISCRPYLDHESVVTGIYRSAHLPSFKDLHTQVTDYTK